MAGAKRTTNHATRKKTVRAKATKVAVKSAEVETKVVAKSAEVAKVADADDLDAGWSTPPSKRGGAPVSEQAAPSSARAPSLSGGAPSLRRAPPSTRLGPSGTRRAGPVTSQPSGHGIEASLVPIEVDPAWVSLHSLAPTSSFDGSPHSLRIEPARRGPPPLPPPPLRTIPVEAEWVEEADETHETNDEHDPDAEARAALLRPKGPRPPPLPRLPASRTPASRRPVKK